MSFRKFIGLIPVFIFYFSFSQNSGIIINDVTQMNPVKVTRIVRPNSALEIINELKRNKGPVSIGGGHFSMGGQTAEENSLHFDMRSYDSILFFSKEKKEITVQAGITWRKIIEFIDTFNLSVKIMQTYADFTVGGSLSVNVHGRYIGQGPVILSVREIKVILANGTEETASPFNNPDLFYGSIGGYGGLGIISEVTLELEDNCKVERNDTLMKTSAYKDFFLQKIRNDSSVIFHNADFYPNRYNKVRAVSYCKTNKAVTIKNRLKPKQKKYSLNRFVIKSIASLPGGKWMRKNFVDPFLYRKPTIEWRNYEATYDVMELEPKSRKKNTYVLQEYFIPVDSFNVFYPRMKKILNSNHVNVINISIRHAKKDPGSIMAWAKTEVFAFVIYYRQGTKASAKQKVMKWTRELTDAALQVNGSYYLPYQVLATQSQFKKAYPNANTFFELKKKLDPENRCRNKLWDAYNQ